MGQQLRARAKRKRRNAYNRRKRDALRATRREPPKPKVKKQAAAAE